MVVQKYLDFLEILRNIEVKINESDLDDQVKLSLLGVINKVRANVLGEIHSSQTQNNTCLKTHVISV